jgi:hypothetical protein
MKFANPAGKSGFYGGRRATFLLGAAFTQVLTGPALSRADFFRIRGGCCGGRFTPNGGADFGFYLGSYDADRHALVDVTGVEVSRVSEPWALPALAAALGALLVALATGAGLLRRTAP